MLGDYVVQLIVTDDGTPPLSSALLPQAYVTLSSFNQAPTAAITATPTIPYVGQTVSLDGSASDDPELDSLTYFWTVTMRPVGSVAPLMNPTSSMASIALDVPGTYEVTLEVSDFLGAGTPAMVTLVASSAASFAEAEILAACATVQGLSKFQVTNKGNQKEFCKLLRKAISDIDKGHYAKAVKKLAQAIERTDGCPLRGTPDTRGDGRDWITDCAAQAAVYADLIDAKNALATLTDSHPRDRRHDHHDGDCEDEDDDD